MTTIPATGYDPGSAYTPTLTVSGGQGNEDGLVEVHLLFREQDLEETRCLMAWFDADALLEAIGKSVEISRQSGLKAAS